MEGVPLYGNLDQHLLEAVERQYPADDAGQVRVPARLILMLLQPESSGKISPPVAPPAEPSHRPASQAFQHPHTQPTTPLKSKHMRSKRTRSANTPKADAVIHSDPPVGALSEHADVADSTILLGLIERRYMITSPRILGILHQHKDFRLFSAMECFPELLFTPTAAMQLLAYLQGPGESTSPSHTYATYACGRSVSTYPRVQGRPYREGDPICDRFSIRLYENRTVAAIADGHQWGNASRKAAKRATRWFVSTLEQTLKEMKNLKSCGPILLSALAHAHERIMRSEHHGSWSRAASLLGGALFEVDLSAHTNGNKSVPSPFVFSFISVGSCRCYLYSTSTGLLRDYTVPDKLGLSPGSIGGNEKPDLRDLSLSYIPCQEDDLIIMCTPGISDNFDPVVRGEMPPSMDSKDLALRQKLSLQCAQSLLPDPPTVTDVVDSWIEHAEQTTKTSREFIETDSSNALSSDRTVHPGKMDHSTCICFRVGRVTLSYREWMSGR